MLNRRRLLGGLAAAVAIAFDPVRRSWHSSASAATCNSFAGVPVLTGSLHLDLATRDGASRDQGNLVQHVPCAVLRPGNAEDIRRMVEFCRAHGISVAARGQHHTMFGQGLVAGLIIEMKPLATIHSIGNGVADVDAGVVWADLILAAYAKGWMFPALTAFHGLSVGGTLSMGGISGGTEAGAIVDHALGLDVVTGTAHVEHCTMQQKPDLFEAALAGLGQCGIITRAQLEVVPAKALARTYLLHYLNVQQMFRDLDILVRRGEHDLVFVLWLPNGGVLVPQINAVKFYDLTSLPNDGFQMRGLSVPALLVPHTDLPYLVFAAQIDAQVLALDLAMSWSKLVKPWFDVWVPGNSVQSYVSSILPQLTLDDIGLGGFALMFPHRRSRFTRPFFRVPDDDGSGFVHLFGILTASLTPSPPPAFVPTMLARNRRYYDQVAALGGTKYPHCAIEFTHADWVRQYGASWPAFQLRKQTYDPDGILTPGPGIF